MTTTHTKLHTFFWKIKLTHLIILFVNEEIDCDLLESMTMKDFTDIGVSDYDCYKIINNLNLII